MVSLVFNSYSIATITVCVSLVLRICECVVLVYIIYFWFGAPRDPFGGIGGPSGAGVLTLPPCATKSKRYDFVLEEPLEEGVMYNILEYQDLNRHLEFTILKERYRLSRGS